MNQNETPPIPQDELSAKKGLDEALADFEHVENNPDYNLKSDETIEQYFTKRLEDPQITLVVPIPKNEDEEQSKLTLIETTSQLRHCLFQYLHEYISRLWSHLDAKQQEDAWTDLEIDLGERIMNLRHAIPSQELTNLFIQVKKVGDIALVVKLMNPTPVNPKTQDLKYGHDSFYHGINITGQIENDPKSPVRIKDNTFSIVNHADKIVAFQDEITISPKDEPAPGI